MRRQRDAEPRWKDTAVTLAPHPTPLEARFAQVPAGLPGQGPRLRRRAALAGLAELGALSTRDHAELR